MENQQQLSPIPVTGAPLGSGGAATPTPLDGLQFQRGEISAKACVVCSREITDEYFQLNGIDLCPGCAATWQAGQQKPSAGRVWRGVMYGFGAAVAGAVLMAVVSGVTGYQISLVSIAVGWMVGKAFRKATGGYTSKRCQWLALALAYFGITMSVLPDFFAGSREAQTKAHAAAQGAKGKDTAGTAALAVGSETDGAQSRAGIAKRPRLTAGEFFLGLAAILGLGLASPFLLLFAGFSGIINAVIVFFGVQQAWRLMAPDPRQLVGPLSHTAAATI